MFSKLLDFAYERSWKEALGFYIVSFVVVLVLGAVLGGAAGGIGKVFFGLTSYKEGFILGQRVGVVVAIVGCWAISGAVLKAKGLHTNALYIGVALLSGAIAALAGGLAGMIPAAYLTTRGVQGKGISPTQGE